MSEPQGTATELLERFAALDTAVTELTSQLKQLEQGPLLWDSCVRGLNDAEWRQYFCPSATTDHNLAAAIYGCLMHGPDGDGRDTWQMAGLIAVPAKLLGYAQQVNEAKSLFSQAMQGYKENTALPHRLNQVLADSQSPEIRKIFERVGSNRIHIRHCTRRIFTLAETPKMISLSWIKQRRSITKVSLDQCEKALTKLSKTNESGSIETQLSQLAQLSPKEAQLSPKEAQLLRKVQVVSNPSVKAKVFWENGESEDLGYLSMPAMVVVDEMSGALPQHTKLAAKPPREERKKRCDNLLAKEPFLPSIHVYLTKRA